MAGQRQHKLQFPAIDGRLRGEILHPERQKRIWTSWTRCPSASTGDRDTRQAIARLAETRLAVVAPFRGFPAYFCSNSCTWRPERILPGCIHRSIKTEAGPGWEAAWVLYVPDKAFSGLYPFRLPSFTALASTSSYPKALGGPPIDETFPVADMRTVGAVLWEGKPEISGGSRIRGDAYGRVKGFFDQCSSFLPGLRKFGVPDAQIVLVEREYICLSGNRVVLFPVCVYGAPGHIKAFRWKKDGRVRGRIDAIGRRPRTRGKKRIEIRREDTSLAA